VLDYRVADGLTLVHFACLNRLYRITLYFINDLHFDVDFYQEYAKLTLIHVIARYHTSVFREDEKLLIGQIIAKTNNLLLKNNFGRTTLSLAKFMNCKENVEFLRSEYHK